VEPQAFADQHRQQLDALLDRLKDHLDATLPAKRLMGAATHHFGACSTRKAREHDYLWAAWTTSTSKARTPAWTAARSTTLVPSRRPPAMFQVATRKLVMPAASEMLGV
jgi:hypothetical protein